MIVCCECHHCLILVVNHTFIDADELEWYIPAAILPSDLQRSINVINQFLETPFSVEGKKASQLLSKKKPRRQRRRRSPSPNSLSSDEDEEAPKKKRRGKLKKAGGEMADMEEPAAVFTDEEDGEKLTKKVRMCVSWS